MYAWTGYTIKDVQRYPSAVKYSNENSCYTEKLAYQFTLNQECLSIWRGQ